MCVGQSAFDVLFECHYVLQDVSKLLELAPFMSIVQKNNAAIPFKAVSGVTELSLVVEFYWCWRIFFDAFCT